MYNISDLSENADQKPVQPILPQFPRHIISNKLRSSWYLKRPWIECSIRLDKIFCFYCRYFALNINHISKQDVYIT